MPRKLRASLRRGAVFATLSVDADKTPPTEFRIFAAGSTPVRLKADSTPVLFDEQAAAAVMAAWQRHGADVMIDLEHYSLDDDMIAKRTDADEARGWCQLELRAGELWAVNVRWTPDGARRLVTGTQRYLSPAFTYDDDGRPTEIVNMALCAMPAMCGLDALIAASRRGTGLARPRRHASVRVTPMDPELIKAALDALESGDLAAVSEALKAMIAGGGSGESPPADALGTDPPAPADAEPVEESVLAASIAEIRQQLAKLTADAAERDSTERAALVTALVSLRAETPATAYEGDGKARKLTPRLVSESIASLRSRVAALRAAAPKTPVPPVSTAGDTEDDVADKVARLSATVRAELAKRGETPEDYVRRRDLSVRRV